MEQLLAIIRLDRGAIALLMLAIVAFALGADSVLTVGSVSIWLIVRRWRRNDADYRAQLEHSEQRLRRALEAGHLGSWEWDMATRQLVWSEGTDAIFGPGFAERAGDLDTYLERIVHPDDLDLVTSRASTSLQDDGGYTIDYRIRRSDGQLRWVSSSSRGVRDADGVLSKLIGTIGDVTERKETEANLRTSQDRLQSVLEHAPVILFATDAQGRFTVVQGRALDSIQLSAGELLGASAFDVLGEASGVAASLTAALAGEPTQTRLSYPKREFDCTLAPIVDAAGVVSGISGVAIDVTERSRAQAQLEQQATMLAEQAALLNLAHSGILVWDIASGAIRFWNRGAEDLYGWPAAEVLGVTASSVLDTEFPRPLGDINAELVRNGHWEGELVHAHRDGTRLVVASRWALQVDVDGKPRTVLAINTDISERKKAELELEHLAHHDPLTTLPNRALLQEALESVLGRMQQHGTPFALLSLDLDRFKDINDTLGHAMGDIVLQRVAERLVDAVRPTDTVARFGGDEFSVLLPGADRRAALEVATRLHERLGFPFDLDGMRLEVGASVGLALGPEHGEDADTLLRRADIAMYAAKRNGSGVVVFAPEFDGDNAERLALTADLRRALETEQLVLHYQPKIDRGGQLVGVEALVRWQHPERGLLPPDQFIALAEQAGLIEALTRWVLSTARRQQVEWSAQGLDLSMAVNLSMRSMHDPKLVDSVHDLLLEYPLRDGRLELELTESLLMTDPDRTRLQLERVRALGVRIAVDDFGTGYSSLAYLKRLPVDDLKIDRCFVETMATDARDRALVQATIDMAHTLGLRVVAEGVEDAPSLELLRHIGCDMMQGYFISRPRPAEDLTRWAQDFVTPPSESLAA